MAVIPGRVRLVKEEGPKTALGLGLDMIAVLSRRSRLAID
jgi:hypothetical protein